MTVARDHSRRRRALVAAAAAVALLAGTWIGRGSVYRALVRYRVERVVERERLPRDVKARHVEPGAGIEALIEAAAEQTGDALSFRLRGRRQGVAEVLARGTANCKGYAALYAAILDEMIGEAGLVDRYRVEHVRGTLLLAGVISHDYPWVPAPLRDHDFVRIADRDGRPILVDPSLDDSWGILRVR